MKNICLYFQIHQPFRLRRYGFFDIGHNHSYFDERANGAMMKKVAKKCYLPANAVLLDLIREYGKRFKVSFSISGVALDQMQLYAPEVMESFQELADTGCVEFLAETNAHSLSSLVNQGEFRLQVREHTEKIEYFIGQSPRVFRNTELICSDAIASLIDKMGYVAMLAEGAEHVLGWRSPNFLYFSAVAPRLKLLLKNFRLSDDIAFRFSQRSWSGWP